MSVKINLKIVKPSKDLFSCAYVYTVMDRGKHYLNPNSRDLMVMFSFINKDWFNVINNIDISRSLCEKLIGKERLATKEKRIVGYYDKVINIPKIKISKIYSEKINIFKKEIIPKIENILEPIFSDTTAKANVFFTYKPLVGYFGGCAFKNGVIFSVENNFDSDDWFFRLATHELIHVVCNNNVDYKKLCNNVKDYNIFDEVFTSTLENICMYKLGYEKKKFVVYRYGGRIRDNEACQQEDKIRLLYDTWEKSRSKQKFVEYLSENLGKLKSNTK